MTTAEKYVTAVYLAVLATVLLWVVIYAFKIVRLERDVAELLELAGRREPENEPLPERASVAE
jgi:hypothetical protein